MWENELLKKGIECDRDGVSAVLSEDKETRLRVLFYPLPQLAVMLAPNNLKKLTGADWLELLRAAGKVGKKMEQGGWDVLY